MCPTARVEGFSVESGTFLVTVSTSLKAKDLIFRILYFQSVDTELHEREIVSHIASSLVHQTFQQQVVAEKFA